MLELKDFRFSLWQVFLPCMLYEKAASKATSAEPPPRWAIGTGQLSCLQFRSGPIARRGGRRYNTIFYICCVRQDMPVYMKLRPMICNNRSFDICCGQVRSPMRSVRGSYTGMFPCFFAGLISRLVPNASRASTRRALVSAGRITASTNPRFAAQ